MTVNRPARRSGGAPAVPIALTRLLGLLPGNADAAPAGHGFRENRAGPHDFVPVVPTGAIQPGVD